MKKSIILAVVLVLLCNMAIAGYATQDGLVIADAPAVPGEVVYLKLCLTQAMRVDALGVTFTFDDQSLELVEEECSWAKQGVLQDFDRRKKAGVWADSKVTEFTGEVCTLAFRVITEKQYFDTTVSCTLVLKNGAEDVGRVQADARVFSECAHEFGGWTDKGETGHQHICRLCQTAALAPHSWKLDMTKVDPARPDVSISVFVCVDCGAKRSQEHDKNQDPTSPETQGPTQPSSPQGNGNSGTNATTPSGDHTGHNHGTLIPDAEWFGVAAVFGIVAVLVGAAVFFVKKKR